MMGINSKLLQSRTGKNTQECEYLDLARSKIGQIEQLDDFARLDTLNLRGNNISFITNLQWCSNLWHLNLSCNRIESVDGLETFLALGTLDLSGNRLTWVQLMRIQHLAILSLSLAGNEDLDKKRWYRVHVIDSMPQIWMLDGQIVTSTERIKVEQFFQDSAESEHPIRHILPKKSFLTSEMRVRDIYGTFGKKAHDLLLKFPLHMKLNRDVDLRRFAYLIDNMQNDLVLQSSSVKKPYTLVSSCPGFISVLVAVQQTDRVTFNTILLMLVASLQFPLPLFLIEDFLNRVKLTSVGELSLLDLFRLPHPVRRSVASILFSAVKLDRDDGQDGGLHDMLYLSLYSVMSEQSNAAAKQCTEAGYKTRRNINIHSLVAIEAVQLFLLCPAFFALIGRDSGVMQLVTTATCSKMVHEMVEMLRGTYSEVTAEKLLAECDKAGDRLWAEMWLKALRFYYSSVRLRAEQEFVLTTSGALPKKAVQQSIYAAQFQTRGLSSPRRPTIMTRRNRPDCIAPANVGDTMLLGPQLTGRVISVPDPRIVLVQMLRIPTEYGAMVVNTREVDQHYAYENLENFEWDPTIEMWRPLYSTGDRITLQSTFEPKTRDSFVRPASVSMDAKCKRRLMLHFDELDSVCSQPSFLQLDEISTRPTPNDIRLPSVQSSCQLASVAVAFKTARQLRLVVEPTDVENWTRWLPQLKPSSGALKRLSGSVRKQMRCTECTQNSTEPEQQIQTDGQGSAGSRVTGAVQESGRKEKSDKENIGEGLGGKAAEDKHELLTGLQKKSCATSASNADVFDAFPHAPQITSDNDLTTLTKNKKQLSFKLPVHDRERVNVVTAECGDLYFTDRQKLPCTNVLLRGPDAVCRLEDVPPPSPSGWSHGKVDCSTMWPDSFRRHSSSPGRRSQELAGPSVRQLSSPGWKTSG